MNGPPVQVRAGLPRLAARLRAGRPSTIVAFGTSMTLFGQYLRDVPDALAAAFGPGAQLVNAGLRGFGTFMAAFRVATDVVPYAPDAVLIEFAHNDGAGDAPRLLRPALEGIIAQIRAARPACEIAFVYLAPAGTAAGGPAPAMQTYEAVAEAYGVPSIDLAAFSEAIVATGRAAWTGPGGLTIDGIHHSDVAAELIGGPFARALVDLIRQSPAGAGQRLPAAAADAFVHTVRLPATACLAGGEWATGFPADHDVRNADAYGAVVAQGQTGARLRVAFDGTQAIAWTRRTGALRTTVDGGAAHFEAQTEGETGWSFTFLTPPLAPAVHHLDIEVAAGPLVVGDVCLLGRPIDGSAVRSVIQLPG